MTRSFYGDAGSELSFFTEDDSVGINDSYFYSSREHKRPNGCNHFTRNVGSIEVERSLGQHRKGSPLKCGYQSLYCRTSETTNEIQVWMCLGCGVMACGPPCTYGTHMHQHLLESPTGKHTLAIELGDSFRCWCKKCRKWVPESNTVKVKTLFGKIKRHFSSELSEEEANLKFRQRTRCQMRCYSSSSDVLDDPHAFNLSKTKNSKINEVPAKLSLQDKNSIPAPISETSPVIAVAIPDILVNLDKVGTLPVSPSTVPESPSCMVTPTTAAAASSRMTVSPAVPVVSEVAASSVTPVKGPRQVPRQGTPIPRSLSSSPDSPAVVTSWGSPEKTRRRSPSASTLHIEQEHLHKSPPMPVAFPFQPPEDDSRHIGDQEGSHRSSTTSLHNQQPEGSTVPHKTPHVKQPNCKSFCPGSLGKRSGKSRRLNLKNKEDWNRKKEASAKKNLMQSFGDQMKTPDWRNNPLFANVSEELKAGQRQRRKAQETSKPANGNKGKPKQKRQGKGADKATENSQSVAGTCEESRVEPEVEEVAPPEVPYSKPVTRGATQARRRAITSYEGGVVMVKAVFTTALNDSEPPEVNGLINFGNTCFLNAILQCLAQSPLFLNELIRTFDEQTIKLPGDPNKGVEPLQINLNSWGPVTHNLALTLSNIPAVSFSVKEACKPDDLVKVLGESTRMDFESQQDAQELLIILFQTLREEYKLKLVAKIEDSVQKKYANIEEAKLALQMFEQQVGRDASFVPNVLFQGSVTSTISCDQLRKTVEKSEIFTNLSLPIVSSRKRKSADKSLSPSKCFLSDGNLTPLCDRYANLHPKLTYEQLNPLGDAGKKLAKQVREEKQAQEAAREEATAEPETINIEETEYVYTLQSCLQQFMASQCMTDYNCSCRKLGGIHTIQTKIREAPRILVLHLKRFRMHNEQIEKIDTHVSFPTLLDITDFCEAKCKSIVNRPLELLYGVLKNQSKLLVNFVQGNGTVMYSLYAVLHHSGSFARGHYIADVKVRHTRDLASGAISDDCQWFVMNDKQVTKTTEKSVSGRQAYLLFYEKVN